MKCDCGKEFELNGESVTVYLCTNEEGEEYTEYLVECPFCMTDIMEKSEWGHMDLDEVIAYIKDEIY